MNKRRRQYRFLAALVAGIGVIAILAVCVIKFMPTRQRMMPEDYFGLTGTSEAASALGGTEAAVIVEDHLAQERAVIIDGSAYIDYTLVQRELNSRFHWDASAGLLLFTTPDQLFEIAPNGTSYTTDGQSFDAGYEILKTTSSGLFLSVNFMQQYSNLKFDIYDSPSRIVVTRGSVQQTAATVKRDSAVRYLGGIKSPIITDVSAGSQVRVLEQMENWSQVMTSDGYIGYIKNNRLSDIQTITTDTFYQEPQYTNISLDEKVNLVWHQINYPEMNSDLKKDISDMSGVNVISPTWYYLSDNEGGVLSYADASYVKRAHKKGLQVWALISNFSEDVSTTALLASRTARQNVQNYLISQALELGFDGINIDFEGIAQEAGYDYVQFMRELSILCRKNQIILSVDVPVPMDFSKHYNRRELGVVCDYVIMMGYDEHYAGSEVAGSVASMDFERTGIENMLSEVPKEKLVSAIPFYSRIWYTATNEDGSTTVTSEAVSMDYAEQTVAQQGAEKVFDASTGQQYAEWTDDQGRLCQIWLEDEESVRARALLVKEFELAGIAEWVLGNERPAVWPIISESIQ
ncbi:MAG: glycosyl hydrolase family 18 protein [Lachnospiraceae bacterium]|nr:glycosyl hydrolase family 18 protein [Lachnospiraceae bacterium]